MKKDFWLERWEKEEIGFHQDEINPCLREFWQKLRIGYGSLVFVPLCGKSLDMQWLREQGHQVVGVELSAIAAQAFFQENEYIPQHTVREPFDCYEVNGIRILCGDFFDLGREELTGVRAVFDRASLIALPPEMRVRYARHMTSILPRAAQILLVTIDYPQQEMSGPPFSVTVSEIETLYGEHADVRLLAQRDVLAQNLRFQQRGLSRLQENTVLLTLR
ncbi:MAG: thiopurine S-methyltransferase [Nitrosomonadales bacterium]|nr:thiopurine S-methyltransferase [Nitrosomonadales bacterium]